MSAMVLVHDVTGQKIQEGSSLRHQDGSLWEFRGLEISTNPHTKHGEHVLKMSRRVRVGHAMLSQVRYFTAEAFGCVLREVEKVYRDVKAWYRFMSDQFIVPLWLGVIALIVLIIAKHAGLDV